MLYNILVSNTHSLKVWVPEKVSEDVQKTEIQLRKSEKLSCAKWQISWGTSCEVKGILTGKKKDN